MGRAPCCSKVGLHRGPWTPREDTLLTKYIQAHGEGHWRSLPKKAGILRCGKSCRLRWMNYLRPDIKRGNITPDEDDLILRLHSLLGNRWSLIAGRLPGRTDNEIKNYWNTHLSKRLKSKGTAPNPHKKIPKPVREPKKRKKNNSEKKDNGRVNGETTSIKIHLPKPIRLTSFSIPRNNSFDSNNTVSGSSSHDQGDKGVYKGALDLPWSDLKDVGVLVTDEDHDLINGCDLAYRSPIPAKDTMLEKLYEEYLQLLKTEEDQVQLDSFTESLFV